MTKTMRILKENTFRRYSVLLGCMLIFASITVAQDNEEEEVVQDLPIRPPFESSLLIDNQTTVVPSHKTFQFDIQHRFGLIEKGIEDLYGLYSPSNIRMGFSYVIIKNMAVGFGFTKNQKPVDFNLKYALIQQTRSGRIPISITYFGSGLVDTRPAEEVYNSSDRYAYFHQVIVSRRFSSSLSAQVAPSITHFNMPVGTLKHDHIAAALGIRYKFSPQTAVIFNYDQPVTRHISNNPNPNLSLGIEVSTSAHAFQIFLGNYNALNPQYNNLLNSNDYRDKEFLIGFNITRLWGF